MSEIARTILAQLHSVCLCVRVCVSVSGLATAWEQFGDDEYFFFNANRKIDGHINVCQNNYGGEIAYPRNPDENEFMYNFAVQ